MPVTGDEALLTVPTHRVANSYVKSSGVASPWTGPAGGPGSWTTLNHNLGSFLGGTDTTARVRYGGVMGTDTFLYTGIRRTGGATEDLKVFNVTNPDKLAYKGGVTGVTWGGTGLRLLPQFWPDEAPEVLGVLVPPQGSTGNPEPGGIQVVEIGPAFTPLDDPVLHGTVAVTLGSFSGGQVGPHIQNGERIYYAAQYGFVNTWRLVYAFLSGTTIASSGETTYFGASESLPSGSRRHLGPLDYSPTTGHVHSFTNSTYGVLFNELAGFITADNPGTHDALGGLFHFYDQPIYWKLRERGGGINEGVEILYVDGTDPVAPVVGTTWTIKTDGDLLGRNVGSGMVQATYDHDKMMILMNFSGTYKVLDLNFVTQEILNEWELPIPPPTTDPYGTFVTKDAAYFGLWDGQGVYLLALNLAAEQPPATVVGQSIRIYSREGR
jgi:hypothetical protein